MTRDQATAFVTRYMLAWKAHDVCSLAELYAADAVVISPIFGQLCGRQAIANSYRQFFAAFPDSVTDAAPEDIVVEGSRIVIFAPIQFTHSAQLFGIAPSGARIELRTVVLVITLAGEKVVREHRMYDSESIHGVLDKLLLDRELKAAAEVQHALLPRGGVVCDYCAVAGASIPCRMIGGDFFEHVELPSGGIGVALGDVSGKGPPAALLASMLQGIFAVEAEAGRGPAEMMSTINRVLLKRGTESRFATFFYGVVTSNGRFTYSNAGHNPPILLSRGGHRSLTTGGRILGMFDDATFNEETIELHAGDAVVCFTDGVTEALNSQDEEYGDDRLMSCLNAANAESSSHAMIGRVFKSMREFCGDTAQRDDITMLVVRFLPKAVEGGVVAVG
jgi:uncharacterized protein (TIGR02246 family)